MKHEPSYKSSLTPLLRWLTGDATRHDERALNGSAQGDPFLADAIEGYRAMPEADHAADVTRLKARLRQKNQRRRGFGFYLMRAAAVGAVLVSAWLVMQQFVTSDKSAVAEAAQAPSETTTTSALADSVQSDMAAAEEASPEAAPTAGQSSDQLFAQKKNTPAARPTQPQANAPATAAPVDADGEAGFAVADEAIDTRLRKDEAPPQQETAQTRMNDLEMAAEEKPTPAAALPMDDLAKASKKKSDAPAKPASPPLRQISGKVTDETRNPLIGVSVMASGDGGAGTSTNTDGSYALGVKSGTASLIFSYTGYAQVEVNLGKGDRLDVTLSESDASLSEVVITAAGAAYVEPAPVESPRPAGGFRAYKKYVSDNLRHPQADQQPRPRQVVRVKFTIEANGSLSNFTAKGDAPQAYKDEAMRLLREGPRWRGTPGTTASYRFVFE